MATMQGRAQGRKRLLPPAARLQHRGLEEEGRALQEEERELQPQPSQTQQVPLPQPRRPQEAAEEQQPVDRRFKQQLMKGEQHWSWAPSDLELGPPRQDKMCC